MNFTTTNVPLFSQHRGKNCFSRSGENGTWQSTSESSLHGIWTTQDFPGASLLWHAPRTWQEHIVVPSQLACLLACLVSFPWLNIYDYLTWFWLLRALYQTSWPGHAPGPEGLEASQLHQFQHSLSSLTLSMCLKRELALVSCVLLSSADAQPVWHLAS